MMPCIFCMAQLVTGLLVVPTCEVTPSTASGRRTVLQISLPHAVGQRWACMSSGEGVSTAAMLQSWVGTRWDALQAHGKGNNLPGGGAATPGVDPLAGTAPLPLRDGSAIEWPACPHDFDPGTIAGALELMGFARAELDCTEEFLQAVTMYGRHLLLEKKLATFDIIHELIRAETGYRLVKAGGKHIDTGLFDDFLIFQKELSDALQGWALWEYEFIHWQYHKRPTAAVEDEYLQLYNHHRAPQFQDLGCPAIPLVYRMWSNFPTCPPSRLQDLPRFTDAYISAMTVDNWRASYRDFLSEGYNYNTSFFAGGDPMHRLSKGAHSIFAGVFIQKLPTDLWCYQQVIHDSRPQYIIDLGSSQGGSTVWFASMLKLFEIPGKVISVDLPLDQAYWLSKRRAEDATKRLKLEGKIDWNYVVDGSKNVAVRRKVERLCSKAPCMVVSDSDHDYAHTYWELEWYARHVGVGQYLVVEDTNIYGWNGWVNINDPNEGGHRRGPMEAANDFEFNHRADYIRTDWCSRHYGLSQTPNGWFFRKSWRARGISN